MSLLSHNDLVELVAQGVITAVSHDQINSASIDITLGDKVLVEQAPTGNNGLIDFSRRDHLQMRQVQLDSEEGIVLAPGQFILAHSVEVFNLPNTISAEYKLKSSMARIGLEHLNAGWCDAGWHGSALTLELKNMSQFHCIRLRPGDSIGQIVFFAHEPVPSDRSYAARGRYNLDSTVSGIKL